MGLTLTPIPTCYICKSGFLALHLGYWEGHTHYFLSSFCLFVCSVFCSFVCFAQLVLLKGPGTFWELQPSPLAVGQDSIDPSAGTGPAWPRGLGGSWTPSSRGQSRAFFKSILHHCQVVPDQSFICKIRFIIWVGEWLECSKERNSQIYLKLWSFKHWYNLKYLGINKCIVITQKNLKHRKYKETGIPGGNQSLYFHLFPSSFLSVHFM